jgi:hypothetical protein
MTEPDSRDISLLEEQLYEFNVEATGIADGKLFGLFPRKPDGTAIGGTVPTLVDLSSVVRCQAGCQDPGCAWAAVYCTGNRR